MPCWNREKWSERIAIICHICDRVIVFVAIELSKWVIRRRDLLLPRRHAARARSRLN